MNRIYNIQNQYDPTARALQNRKILMFRSYKCASQWSSSAGHKADQKAHLQLLLAVSITLEENDLGGETAIGSAGFGVWWAHKPPSANISAWLHLRSDKMTVKSPNEMEEAVRVIFNEACNSEMRMRSYSTYTDTDLCSNEMWVLVPSEFRGCKSKCCCSSS
jgi:hypothetical protein